MARLASHCELARMVRQHQHVQDYYDKKLANESDRRNAASVPVDKEDLVQAEADDSQNLIEEYPSPMIVTNDACDQNVLLIATSQGSLGVQTDSGWAQRPH